MCGRFASFLPPKALRAIFRTVNPLPNAGPTWNLAPTQDALVVRQHPETGGRHLDLLRWGFIPPSTKDLTTLPMPINARAESVARNAMFRESFARRRCLVPAGAFYEWRAVRDGRQPYAIARADGAPLALAGIWSRWNAPTGEVIRSFVILTTAANATMRVLHNRMPVIIEEPDWPAWLGGRAGRSVRAAAICLQGCAAVLAGEPGGQQRTQQWAGPAGPDRRSAGGATERRTGRPEPGIARHC